MGKLPVHTGLDRRCEVVQGSPVCDDVSLPAPLLAHYRGEQLAVRAGGDPVQSVVRAHDASHLPILGRHLEGQQVELVQRSRRDHGVPVVSIGFLFVADNVLRHRVDPLCLNALDGLDTHDTGQVGVLAREVEIASAVGMTHHVHQRPEQHLVPPQACFIAEHISQLPGQVGIERRPYGRGRRNRGGFRLGQARTAAQPGAAVCHADARDAELGDAVDVTRDPLVLGSRADGCQDPAMAVRRSRAAGPSARASSAESAGRHAAPA